MKKKLTLVLAIVMVLSCIMLVACSKQATSIAFDETTLPTRVLVGEEVDYSAIKIEVEYEDGSKETLALTDKGVTYEAISTQTSGNKTLQVTFGGKSVQAVIVVATPTADDLPVTKYANAAGYVQYQNAIKEQTNKQTEYYVRDDVYQVGNNNGYVFVPETLATNIATEETFVNANVQTTHKLYEKIGSEYQLVNDESAYLTKVENNVYYFNASAVGKQFKLEVTLGEKYQEETIVDVSKQTVAQEFEVVDGYNVYDALGLSVMDNRNVKSWASLKTTKLAWDNGKALSEFTDVKQVILHNDLTLSKADFPSNYFWTENESAAVSGNLSYAAAKDNAPEELRGYLTGSLKEVCLGEDWENGSGNRQRGLYVSTGIGLNGNYHKITINSGISEQGEVSPNGGLFVTHDFNNDGSRVYPEPHWSLIAYNVDGLEGQTFAGTCTIKNVDFVGATQKSENSETPAGIMMLHAKMRPLTIENVLATKWFCNAEVEGDPDNSEIGATVIINNSKLYDSFSQMIFSWYGKQINVTNSEMIGAGGPLFIIQSQTTDDAGENGVIINVDENCNLQSWLTGAEVWFTINNMPESTIGQLIQLGCAPDGFAQFAPAGSGLSTHFGKTRTVGDKTYACANIVAVVIPSPSKVFTSQHALKAAGAIAGQQIGMDEVVFAGIQNLAKHSSEGATMATTLKTTLGGLGMHDFDDALDQLNAGFTAFQQLILAPIFKCGNNYAYFDGATLGNLVHNAQQLYGGCTLAITSLSQNAGAMPDGEQKTALLSIINEWQEYCANFAFLQTAGLTTELDDTTWVTGWLTTSNTYSSLWVNAGGLSKPADPTIQYFELVFGQDTAN